MKLVKIFIYVFIAQPRIQHAKSKSGTPQKCAVLHLWTRGVNYGGFIYKVRLGKEKQQPDDSRHFAVIRTSYSLEAMQPRLYSP